MDIRKVESSWKGRGFSFGVWIDPPGQAWEDYRHDTDELFMVVEGEVELEINGKKIRPKTGEEILILQNEIHSVRTLGQKGSRWLYGYRQNNH